MSRTPCCFAPPPPNASNRAVFDRAHVQKVKKPRVAADHYEAPAKTKRKHTPREEGAAALNALRRIASSRPADPKLSDYERAMLVLEGLEACVPWLATQGSVPAEVPALLAAVGFPADPQAAGVLATVLHAACILAMPTTGFLSKRNTRGDGAALFQAVTEGVRVLPGMEPYGDVIDAGVKAAQACANDGKEAMHGAFFASYVAQMSASSPPPTPENAAFLQQSLMVLSSVNVDGAYRQRQDHALPTPLARDPAAHLSKDSKRWVDMVHYQLWRFVTYNGGWGCGPALVWAIEEALTAAKQDAAVLQQMFAPQTWGFRSVHDPKKAHTADHSDLHGRMVGVMYLGVLHYINGTSTRGWLWRKKRQAVPVQEQREFLTQAFTVVHRGAVSMPDGWIGETQLEELHRVALESLAKNCDAHTLRVRLQAYAAAAATSPGLADVDPKDATHVAQAWDAFKDRLHMGEYPLDLPAA